MVFKPKDSQAKAKIATDYLANHGWLPKIISSGKAKAPKETIPTLPGEPIAAGSFLAAKQRI